MHLWFSGHALDRMEQYGISPEVVERVLSTPDEVLVKPDDERVIYDAVVEGRRIGVVVVMESDPPRVVTVMLTRPGYRRR